jgi:hypothetical protein
MSCNILCPCISSVWEQYSKILHNIHFDHVIWYHNAFCINFIWKMTLWICCDIIRLIWAAANIKFDVFCLRNNKTCFSNHLLALFLFLRQYQPKKKSFDMWLSDICKNKCANAKVPPRKKINKNISILQLLSSDCVIYQNLPILLYITVIQLISNIINNFSTYICLICIFNS